jgi:hypothetical protein
LRNSATVGRPRRPGADAVPLAWLHLLVVRLNNGGTVRARWIGYVAAVGTVLVMTGPAPAHADFERGVCTDFEGQITEITAAGPGLVAVEGSGSRWYSDPATCDVEARLVAYAGVGDTEDWLPDGKKGMADVRTPDNRFAVGLDAAAGTFAVCLENVDGRPLDCYQVTVASGRDASGLDTAGVPVVAGRISVHRGWTPSPPPCGHCM